MFYPEKDNAKIKIYFSGTGPFDVTLLKNDKEVTEDSHFKFTVFDDYVIIFIREVEKTDAGLYRLKVKNDSGSADATFTVTITGLPGPPQGPLGISDISKHVATLSWRPPAFDGGCKVTHYIVERRDITHNQWVIASSNIKVRL